MLTRFHFSEQQLNLIRWMCQGGSLKGFAKKRGISYSTAATHRDHICKKFGTSNLAIQTHWAIKEGIINLKTENELRGLGEYHLTEGALQIGVENKEIKPLDNAI